VDAAQVSEIAKELRQFAKAGLHDDTARLRLHLLKRSPVLRGLTPVQVAGGDSKVEYEYLIQAIIDAVDLIGQAASPMASGSSVTGLSEGAREAQALRALFGLTSRTRGRTWRMRQEEAADALSISWDYFRHDRQEGLLQSVAEQILNATQGNHPPSIFDRDPGLWAFATQNDVETQVLEYIRSERPRRATMLEFSTATTGSILRALRDVDAGIYLLAANPERIKGWHEARMRRALSDLLQIDFSDYDKLKMRLYSVPPALRGRRIGELIVIGWYTHRDNQRIDAFDPASVEVWGHDNAVIAGRNSNADGLVLASWFAREFQRLWRHRSTLDETTSARILGRQD
jgi:hypothetical protein